MVTTRTLYLALIACVAAERLVELRLSRRHLEWSRKRGAVERGAGHYPWMVALHAAFLVACPLEVFALERTFRPLLGVPMLVLVGCAMALRYWAVSALGERWNTRVMVVPGLPRVERGPYRWLRHPNYLAVVIEIVALPLVHGAWWSALGFSVANAALLRHRIAIEDAALEELSGGGHGAAAATTVDSAGSTAGVGDQELSGVEVP